MTTTPYLTPEQFLAEPQPDEDDFAPALLLDPLESIAIDLRTLTALVVRRDAQEEAEDQARQLSDQLDADYAELQREHDAKVALIEAVLEVCRPSVSKLAIAVRAVLEPTATEELEQSVTDAEPGADQAPHAAGPQCPACGRYFADAELLGRHACTAQPANDAPLKEWLAYAAARGLEVDPGRTNRSQIRTLLGIAQTTQA